MARESELTALRQERPQFTADEAVRIASTVYGLQVQARELPSERDRNFHLVTVNGAEFTLKIANAGEQKAVLDLQNKAMQRIWEQASGVRCPKICDSESAEPISRIQGSDGINHFVRLVTFLPGVPLGQWRPHNPELLRSIGRGLGSIDQALETFSHQAAGRDLYWNIRNASRIIRDYKHLVEDPGQRALVERLFDEWNSRVLPALPLLRASVIHNDANDYNLIVGGDEIGLIDFGDMLRTYTVAEVAIACAYVMLDKPDPVEAAAHIVAGYHEAYPLTPLELEVLFHFICARLCMSVTIAAHQKQLEPDNEYLKITEEPAWRLLKKLTEVNPRLAHYRFRDACGLPASPSSPGVVSWLKDQTFAPVVAADLNCESLVLDLSISSLELGRRDKFTDIQKWTELLFARLRDAGARVAIGRYNEARGVYTSALFNTESNETPESRTVHLGIDLFMEAGSPIFAPLDGFVHSFRNNASELDYGPTIILRHAMGEGRGEFYTLYGHLSVDSLDGLSAGMPVRKGDRIAKIGTYPTNGGWSPHVHFQIITDMLDRDGEFPGVAAPSQRNVWLSISPDPNLILEIPDEVFPKESPSPDETLRMRHRRLSPSLSLSYRHPLKIVRGWGQYLYDDEARAYLDGVNNVAHVGHCHPRVVRAAQEQIAVLNTNTRYLHDNIAEYGRRLCEKLPERLSVCFFVNSGSEANDLALRLARAHTKSKETIVIDGAYHGNLTSLIEISPYKFDGPGGSGPPPHVRKVAMPDAYRRAKSNYIDELRGLVSGPATFIVESLLSCGGQIVLPPDYLSEAFRLVRGHGGVCIADEVQVALGRVGSHFWGFETQSVVPDIVTMGKPIGNGHPLGAVVTTPEIAASFNNGMEYFNTFGGNPVSCAVGLAVLDVIDVEKLQNNAQRVGAYLKSGLERLAARYPIIGDVRGLGLFVGLELVLDRENLEPAPKHASYAVERMKECGVLLSTDGPLHNVIKIKPPLVFNEGDADTLVRTLDRVLAENPMNAR